MMSGFTMSPPDWCQCAACARDRALVEFLKKILEQLSDIKEALKRD